MKQEQVKSGSTFNGLTIDVEDWFHILDVGGPPMSAWSALPSRVERNTERLLELLASHAVHATFFTLGWIAEHHPQLARRIADPNHEIATHGYAHELVRSMGKERFRKDTRRSKKLLEDISGQRVIGHRAAGFSLTKETMWAFDILLEEGLRYDASVCPVPHGHGGMPGYPLHPYWQRSLSGDTIWEFPVSCLSIGRWRLPFSGGGYLRLLPYKIISNQIRRLNRNGFPATIYLHPREIDPNHPRLPMPLLRRLKSYVNLSTTLPKLERLLKDFALGPLRRLVPKDSQGLAKE